MSGYLLNLKSNNFIACLQSRWLKIAILNYECLILNEILYKSQIINLHKICLFN